MRFQILSLFAFLLLWVCLVGAVEEKWEELDSILEDIDVEKKQRDVDEPKPTEANPCDQHICGWGKECVVDKKGRPVCECVAKCPALEESSDNAALDQVCASNNETYSSLCELYRQRCVCKKRSNFEHECVQPANAKIHLEYLGACKQLDQCTSELMEQFPERMADWLFQVMRELKKRRELHNLEWEELIGEAEQNDEKRHVIPVIWKFCDLDVKPHDRHVTHHELIPITAPVIPMESCIKPFLEKCDGNKDGAITIHEWGTCLGLKEGDIQERC